MGTKKLDELFSDKVVLADGIKEVLSKWMASDGDGCHGSYICEKVLITDIAPADDNVKAMNQIYTQARNRISAQEKAEADKIREIKQAEANAEGKYLMGKGVVEQRKAIVEGLKSSVMEFSDKVEGFKAKDVLELVLLTQYFDSLREIAQCSEGGNLLYFPHNPVHLRELSADIRRSFA